MTKTILLGLSISALALPLSGFPAEKVGYYFAPDRFVDDCGCSARYSVSCEDSWIHLKATMRAEAKKELFDMCQQEILVPAEKCICYSSQMRGHDYLEYPVPQSCEVEKAMLGWKGIDEETGSVWHALVIEKDGNVSCE